MITKAPWNIESEMLYGKTQQMGVVTSVKPIIELVKPSEPDKSFGRGERIIMVDGVRWGRTIIHYHGCHGTSHAFKQEGGDVLEEMGTHYPRQIEVRSQKRRKWTGEPWQPTEEVVLEKVRELVESGKLRHPDLVRAEKEQARAVYFARNAEIEKQRKARFRGKACEALGVTDDGQEIIDRVVAAMEWAQSQ